MRVGQILNELVSLARRNAKSMADDWIIAGVLLLLLDGVDFSVAV